jgi:hypothetical protein
VLENRKNNKFGWIAFYTMGQKYEILANFFFKKFLFFAFFGLNHIIFGYFDKILDKSGKDFENLNFLEKYRTF